MPPCVVDGAGVTEGPPAEVAYPLLAVVAVAVAVEDGSWEEPPPVGVGAAVVLPVASSSPPSAVVVAVVVVVGSDEETVATVVVCSSSEDDDDGDDDDDPPSAGIAGPTSGCSPASGVVARPQGSAAFDSVPP